MEIKVTGLSEVGRRSNNEDALLAIQGALPLAAVADGMGGPAAGEVASATALEVLEDWRERLKAQGGEGLRAAFMDANQTVWERASSDPALSGMGTTLTAFWLDDSKVTLAHVGDTRAYLLRRGNLERLTVDQTLVQQLVEQGRITEQEAFRHPQRNLLSQALGSEPEVEVEILSLDLEPGDQLLISSDGLHDQVPDSRIQTILTETPDPDDACRALVREATNAGSQDNITVLLLTTGGEPTESRPARLIVTKPAAPKASTLKRVSSNKPLMIAIVAVVALLGVAGLTSLLGSASTQILVASRNGRVVIMKGSEGRDGGPAKGEVLRVKDLDVNTLPPTYQRDLRSGIPVSSLDDAERTIASIPRIQGPLQTPAPSPSQAPPGEAPAVP